MQHVLMGGQHTGKFREGGGGRGEGNGGGCTVINRNRGSQELDPGAPDIASALRRPSALD